MKNQNKSQPNSDQGRENRPTHSALKKRSVETQRIKDNAEPMEAQDVLHFTQYVIDNMSDAVYWVAPSGQLVYGNNAIRQCLGYSQAELLKMQITDIVPDYSQAEWASHLQTLKKKRQLVFESQLKKKSGEIFPVEVRTNFIQFEGKEYAFGIAHDITERKRAENDLKLNTERLTRAQEIAHLGLNEVDLTTGKITWSDETYRIFGVDPQCQKINQELFLSLIHPEDKIKFSESLQTSSAGDGLFDLEFRIVRPDGSIRYIHGSGQRSFDQNGKPTGEFGTLHDITEQKQAEEKLRGSESKYRVLLDELNNGIYISDRNGVVTFANRALAYILGFEQADEILGRNFLEFLPHGKHSNLMKQYQTAMMTGSSSDVIITEIVRQNGESRTIEIRPQVIIENGKPVGDQGIVHDITKRNKAEERLRDSEERYRDLVENSHEMIYTHDLYGRLLSVNHTIAMTLGYTATNLIGRNLGELLAPEQRPQFEGYLSRVRRKVAEAGTWVLQNVNGDRRLWEYHSMMRSDAKQGPYVRGMAHDITERTLVEIALRDSEERFHKIFDGAPIGMVLTGKDMKFFNANPAFCRMLGYTATEMNTMMFLDVTHPEHREADRQNVEKLWMGEVPYYRTEKRYIAKNGDIRWGGMSATLIRGQAGEPLYVLTMVEDISERKRAEEGIQRSNAELTALNKIGQMLSKLAEPDEILEIIFTVIGQVLDNRNLFIALYDQASQSIAFPVYAIHGERLPDAPRPLGNGITDYIIRTKAPFLVKQNLAEALKQRGIELIGTPSRSFLAVPMRLGEKVIGVIALQDYERENAYDEQQLELLTTMAAQAATALENARLFAAVQQELEERKQAEMRLRESEEFLRDSEAALKQAQRVAHMGSWKWYIQSNRLVWSDEMYQIFGINKENFTGNLSEVVSRAIHPDDRARVDESNLSVAETGKPIPLEYRVIWPDGSIHTVWAEAGELLRDEKGKPALLTGIVQDITGRKQVEEALRASETRYRTVFEGVEDAIFIESPDGRILDANRRACEMYGYSHAEFLTRKVADLVPSKESIIAFNPNESPSLPIHPIETVNVRANGEQFPIELNINLQSLSGENVLFVVGRDISERKRAETDLAQSREQLRALSQYLQAAREEERTLIAREIHDELGQELTALKMDLAWLTRQLPPEQVRLIQKTEGMTNMVDSTIQTVRRVASELRPGMLDDLGLVAALEWQAGEFQTRSGIACKLDLPENVTTLGKDQATAMFRIFQETLTNIARHAQATKVHIALTEIPESIELMVHDNGIGITQEQLADPHSLGLSGMRERVQAFGGTLEFKSAPGKGTSVHVRMPPVNKQLKKEA